MSENTSNIIPMYPNMESKAQESEETAEKVVELTDEMAESEESAEESEEATEESKENEQKPKVEPLPEQKQFIMSREERRILEEMESRAKDNPALAEGLKDKDKSISECYAFVANRARKLATDNCAMVEDETVFSWAQFYYTQRREIIELEFEKPKKPTYTPPAPKPKGDTKASAKVKKDTKKPEPKKPEPKKPEAEAKKDEDKDMPTLF